MTSVHHPDDPRILHKEGRTLSAAGYRVVLIAPEGRAPSDAHGVQIITVRRSSGRFHRAFGTSFSILRLAWRERADLYHIHDPELILAGLVLKCGARRVIYDVHEDLPRQVLSKYWIPSWSSGGVARLARVAEAIADRLFDGVVVATPTIGARFRNAVVVENFPRVDASSTPERRGRAHAGRPMTVVYVGGIEEARGAVEMVESAGELPPGARLLMAGPIRPSDLRGRLEQITGWDRVDAPGWVSPDELHAVYEGARVGLCVLRPLPNYLDSYPTKLFEYMAAGLPIVASDFPLWRRIVEDAGCGLLVDPTDASAISASVTALLSDAQRAEAMGARGRHAVLERYQWKYAAERLLGQYRRILGES